MSDRATLEGTKRYAKSFQTRAAGGYFREAQGLVLSSLGIGTYLGHPHERPRTLLPAAPAEPAAKKRCWRAALPIVHAPGDHIPGHRARLVQEVRSAYQSR